MGVPGRTSRFSSVVAAVCIIIYIAAISFGAVQIILNIRERQVHAEAEFFDLTDRAASSSVFLGFMSEAYEATLKDFLSTSGTLMGIIITGSGGEYAFEKYPGSSITWIGDSPRFKRGAWLSGVPLYLPLGIEGQRNVTIQAVYGVIDYNLFQKTMKNTLLVVLFALIIALLTLVTENILKKKVIERRAETIINSHESDLSAYRIKPLERPLSRPRPEAEKPPEIIPEEYPDDEISDDEIPDDENPRGLYKPRGNIGWESYIDDRLSSELHRCASFEQDLVLLAIEITGAPKISDSTYCQLTDEAVSFFTMRDMIFGKGENGIYVIMPNTDLDHGLRKSGEFRRRFINLLKNQPENPNLELSIGLSSRSGRLIEAERLMLEACSANERAREDSSHIIGFKSDLEKYREFIKTAH